MKPLFVTFVGICTLVSFGTANALEGGEPVSPGEKAPRYSCYFYIDENETTSEGNSLTFTVKLDHIDGTGSTASVYWATSSGTATEGVDFPA